MAEDTETFLYKKQERTQSHGDSIVFSFEYNCGVRILPGKKLILLFSLGFLKCLACFSSQPDFSGVCSSVLTRQVQKQCKQSQHTSQCLLREGERERESKFNFPGMESLHLGFRPMRRPFLYSPPEWSLVSSSVTQLEATT